MNFNAYYIPVAAFVIVILVGIFLYEVCSPRPAPKKQPPKPFQNDGRDDLHSKYDWE